MRRRKRRGSAMLEFALCGVPLLFAWISTVQMSLGMWHYHTLQFATKAAGAYMSTHGAYFVSAGNAPPKIQDIARILKNAAIGLPTNQVQVTFTGFQGNATNLANPTTHSCRLDSCLTDGTMWPPTNYNTVGYDFEIKTEYQWKNAIAMVTPGYGSQRFGAFWLPGYTHQAILF